jgi:hypothetical protein
MVIGLRRLSDPRAVSSLAAASKATKKKLTQATVKVVNGAVCVKATKTVASAARDSLSAIMDEGLADLTKYLIEHPDRILVTLRIVKDDSYYRITKKSSEQWIHPTLVYFKSVPKRFWKQLLLAYRLATKPHAPWNDPLLNLMDKMQALDGIVNAVCYLGLISMSDKLPASAHYKPLLHDVLLERMTANNFPIDIAMDGTLKFGKDLGVYGLTGLTHEGYYTKIVHHPSGTEANICDDFKVGEKDWDLVDNHDWVRATLVGKRTKESIYTMFQTEDKAAKIGYNKETFLNKLIEECQDEHLDEMRRTMDTEGMAENGVIAAVTS